VPDLFGVLKALAPNLSIFLLSVQITHSNKTSFNITAFKMVYTIASPDEYLAITGAGIKTLKIVKSAWVWPFQRVS
jgi:hypothetical protein